MIMTEWGNDNTNLWKSVLWIHVTPQIANKGYTVEWVSLGGKEHGYNQYQTFSLSLLKLVWANFPALNTYWERHSLSLFQKAHSFYLNSILLWGGEYQGTMRARGHLGVAGASLGQKKQGHQLGPIPPLSRVAQGQTQAQVTTMGTGTGQGGAGQRCQPAGQGCLDGAHGMVGARWRPALVRWDEVGSWPQAGSGEAPGEAGQWQ